LARFALASRMSGMQRRNSIAQHQTEKAFVAAVLILPLLLNSFARVIGLKGSFVDFLAIVALTVIGAFAVRTFVISKDWERYVPFRENRL